jgi:hypothetical protein
MSITVIENFVSEEDCLVITSELDKLCKPHPHLFGYLSALGFETSKKASLVSMTNPVIPKTGKEDQDSASLLLTKYILKLQKSMESHFNQEMSLVNCNYVQMTKGASNELHSDSTELDGTPYHDAEELEFSGLIYFNDYGSDFTGGNILFPKQGMNIKPKSGMAVFFKGDSNHPHVVEIVRSGSRKNAVLFFAKKNNTSDRMLFNDEHSGIAK